MALCGADGTDAIQPTAYDIGSQDGLVYMVVELIEGDTLRDLLKRGALPQSRAVEIAGQVADGLAAAHAGTIVHRDLKPEPEAEEIDDLRLECV